MLSLPLLKSSDLLFTGNGILIDETTATTGYCLTRRLLVG
jgi:hypothetical protein